MTIVAALAATAGAVLALLAARWRRRTRRLPAHALIVSAPKSTVIAADGAVRSIQSALLTLDVHDLERLWSPANLENLGRTYWRFMSTATLGLIRVRYGENERALVLAGLRLTLLRFGAPEYVLEDDHGRITWPIRDGLLVSRAGRGSGFLALDVRREDPLPQRDGDGRATLTIEVEVENFYPAIASALSTLVYEGTQEVMHVLVTHAFLRSLARLELAESKVGRLRG